MTAKEFISRRLSLGLTQQALANNMGYAYASTISHKERGIQSITPRDEILLKMTEHNRGGLIDVDDSRGD